MTYDGNKPHIGNLSVATPEANVLMQAIGPARWVMRYEDEA